MDGIVSYQICSAKVNACEDGSWAVVGSRLGCAVLNFGKENIPDQRHGIGADIYKGWSPFPPYTVIS